MNAHFTLKAGIAATIAAFGMALPAHAQKAATDTTATTAPGNAGMKGSRPLASGAAVDKGSIKFMEKAAAGGMAEVELGKLAQERAANAQVKEFGARMATDHAKANEELRPIADAKHVALPGGPDKKQQRAYKKLAKLSGAEFDKAYTRHMLDDHKKDVKEFQKEANSGKDGDVRNFAAKTLPTLEEHLRLAQSAYDAVHGGKK